MYQIFFKRSIILLLLSFAALQGRIYAQNNKVDSLKSQLEQSSGKQKYQVEYQLAYELFDVDNHVALDYARTAFEMSYEYGDSLEIVKSGRLLGQIMRRVDLLDESIKTLQIVLPIAQRNKLKREEMLILNAIAISYTFNADYDNALDYNLKSLIIREADGNKAEISISLNNIGLVYFKLRNYEKALDYFTRSLILKEEVNDQYNLDRLLINIGLSNVHLKIFDKALEYINRGLKVCAADCANDILVEGKFGLGVANFGLNNLSEAKKIFTESLTIARKSDNKRFQAENLVYLGKIAIANREFDQAETFLTESEKLASAHAYNQLMIDTYKQFSILFSQTKDFENASVYQNKYIHLKDSLIGEELVKNVAKIQTQFEERENIATIKLKEIALVRQRNLNVSLGIIAVLIGLLGFVLYRSNVVTRRVNSALSDAKEIIETQNLKLQNINRELDGKVKEKTVDLLKANDQLDKANRALSHVNDELDNFIYKTSHDIRGPLASLKGICSVALMDVTDQLALDYLKKLDASSERLNIILTRLLIVNQINNAIVGSESIDFKTIVDDVILLEKKKGLPPRFEIKKEIHPDLELHSDRDLVRIILENLIDNAIKFSNDSERVNSFVSIKIYSENGRGVIVSVIDNGIGVAEVKPDKIFQMFSRASERSGTGGIGLYLTKLATEKLGGEIHLRTTPEGYTEFYVLFPTKLQVS